MKKSLLLLLTLVFVASAALAGCGSSTTDESKGTDSASGTTNEEKVEPFELTLRHTQVGESKANRLKILQDVFKVTEEENPGLTIKLDGTWQSSIFKRR